MKNTNAQAITEADVNAGKKGMATINEVREQVEILRTNLKTYRVKVTTEGEQQGTEHTIKHEDFEGMPHNMASTLQKYREGYEVSISANGRKSLSNGDELAKQLEMMTGKQVANLAEKVLQLETDELVKRYANLNNGQVRMNSGNRIRAAIKRGDITIDEVKAAKAA